MARFNTRSTILRSLLVLFFVSWAAAQSTCSATQPCAEGCCSQYGNCGYGADFCAAENCIGNCDAKSECDPGWGAEWSASESCPLNVCCSPYGFCGTTADFCGDTTVTSPSCSGTSASGRTIGYYEGWSLDRPCDGKTGYDSDSTLHN
jgi:chitinase